MDIVKYHEEIELIPGKISFINAEKILNDAQKLVDDLKTVIVTEDTITTNKKLVANVRKKAEELERIRKDVKNELLKPYVEFETKVKEIVNTVKEGEQIVRNQLDDFEKERRDKLEAILISIFNKRLKKYPQLIEIGMNHQWFISPKHLNKTASVEKTEIEIAQYLQKVEEEVVTIKAMENSTEILAEYMSCLDLTKAIREVQIRKQREAELKVQMNQNNEETYKITLYRLIDYKAVQQFMNENNIEFKGDK